MSSIAVFRSDLQQALAVWRSCPWLPVASVVVMFALWAATALPMSPMVRPLPALVSLVALLAWLGLERVVYDRVWSFGSVRWRELAKLAPALAGRFFRLGLVVGLPWLALTWLVSAAVSELVANVVAVVLGVAVLVALTFVTPALVLDEPTVRGALRRGWAMLLSEWRPAVWHIVAPAVVLTGLGAPGTLSGDAGTGALVSGAAALVSLAAKGAVLAYYRRHSGADGEQVQAEMAARTSAASPIDVG